MPPLRWFMVCSVALSIGCAAQPSPPPVYAPAADDTAIAGPAVPPVYLHLVAEEGSVLQRSATRNGRIEWDALCVAPCNGYVPAFGSYRVGRQDHRSSSAFTLPGPPGTRIALKVDDDGRVWTRDSVQLSAQRAQDTATAASWIAVASLLRP